jgi:hypothetical protein
VCGQENVEPRQSFLGLVFHFFEDITHFDGKFFKTVGFLASRPGFLPAEYIKGRRMRYLHPIRMYVFTSALFFFVFYSVMPEWNNGMLSDVKPDLTMDSIKQDTAKGIYVGGHYSSLGQYDSSQSKLSPHDRDGWIARKMVYRSITMNQKYKGREKDLFHNLADSLLHSLPYLLFVSLPLYALYLKLLYFRKRYLYTDHAIFLIYLYIFSFITLLLYFTLDRLDKVPYIGWLGYLKYPVIVYGVLYTILSMKKFYSDSKGKVILRFLLFNILAFITVIILFLLFFVLTLFRL